MGSYTPAPDYGRRLLPVLIDEIARDDPNRACFSMPRTDSDLSQGYEDVTFATFSNAINQLAWLIERTFGRSDKFDAIAYLGTPDIRYHCIQMAAAKTGYQGLSAGGVAVDDILASRPMRHLLIPELDDLLAAPHIKQYPFNKTFEEAANDPYLILHTSGSTGFPKPVRYNHGAMATTDAQNGLSDVDETTGLRRSFHITCPGRQRILIPFLHFHGVSSVAAFAAVVYGGAIYVNGFRHRILERADLFNVLEHANVETAFFSPALIEDLASHPESAKYLKRMSSVQYGGAALNHAAGSFIAKHTYLRNQWGTTETMKLVDLEVDPEDFEYVAWDLEKNGLEFRPVAPDVYEMIVHRTPKSYPYVVFFHREPEATIYEVGDLWTPHPDPKKAKSFWKFCGRTDDLICYQDGNNFHPTAFELKHSEHELIRAAAITGTGHRQPVLLLELYDPSLANTPEKKARLVDKLWEESVDPINSEAPKNGNVAKTHIVIATAEKPFERNVKGTIARKATLKKYEVETESVYQHYGDRTMDVRSRFERKVNVHDHS